MGLHHKLPGEFELIARYFAPLATGYPGAFGLEDDAAVFRAAPGTEVVAKTDAIVGGVHFRLEDSAANVARKALRVNLSDLAAKGAEPRSYMLALMLPDTVPEDWIASFALGLAADQAEYGVHLIGGDTNATTGPPVIAVTALGEIPEGRMLRRGGARNGDLIFVTGTIGDAALGLATLQGDLTLEMELSGRLIERYRLPEPRVGIGPALLGLATATIDVSDGLIADLGHISETSGLDAVIEAAHVPLSSAARAACALSPAWFETTLTGGDDYEIVFTAPPEAAAAIAGLSRKLGVPVTRIGRMEHKQSETVSEVRVLGADGASMHFTGTGWTHFRKTPDFAL